MDTWGWVAYFNPSEGPSHDCVRSLLAEIRGTTTAVITSWPVLTETIGFACSDRGVREWHRDGGFGVTKSLHEFVRRGYFASVLLPTERQLEEALDLRLLHGGIPSLSLVDCTTAILLRDWKGLLVSGDGHFRHLLPDVDLIA